MKRKTGGFASRRTVAFVGLFVAGLFYMLAAGFLISGVAEFIVPERAGLWIGSQSDAFVFGLRSGAIPDPANEVLGWWFAPMAFGLSVLSFVMAQMMARLFLGLMRRRRGVAV